MIKGPSEIFYVYLISIVIWVRNTKVADEIFFRFYVPSVFVAPDLFAVVEPVYVGKFLEELVMKQIIHSESCWGIFDEALVYEILEAWAPSFWDRNGLFLHDMVEKLILF